MIQAIELHNFKCFENQAVACRSLTLLSGLNSSGKSTLIQALLLLRQSYQQGLLPRKGVALNGDLVRIGTAVDALFEGATNDAISIALTMEPLGNCLWTCVYEPSADVLPLRAEPDDSAVYNESLFTDHFHYLYAERIGPRASFEISEFVTHQHRQLGPRGEYSAYFLSTFGQTDIYCPGLQYEGTQSMALQTQVEAWLNVICPGARITLSAHPSLDLISLQYSFPDEYGVSNPYRATNVGFGITYVLPVVVAILASGPGTTLIVENPEAHLHPKGQAHIGRLLARAAGCGIQVIVETHSDHVLNGIRLAVRDGIALPDHIQLHFFRRGAQQRTEVISPSVDANGRIDYWPDDFFDEWDKSLESLLQEPDG